MANHVSTYITVESNNPAVYEKLKELFNGKSYDEIAEPITLYNIFYPENEGYDRSQYSEQMGAKWVYSDNVDFGDDYFEMSTVSAWYFCDGMIKRMGEILSEIDEEVLIKFTFEEETLSPIGGGACYKGKFISYEDEYEWPDEEELSQEEYDEAYDSMWEDVHHICNQLMEDAVRDIIDSE